MNVREHILTSTGALRASATMIILLITVALLAFFTISYVTYGLHKICGLVVLLDDRNQALPVAEDQDTRDFRAALHSYRESNGC